MKVGEVYGFTNNVENTREVKKGWVFPVAIIVRELGKVGDIENCFRANAYTIDQLKFARESPHYSNLVKRINPNNPQPIANLSPQEYEYAIKSFGLPRAVKGKVLKLTYPSGRASLIERLSHEYGITQLTRGESGSPYHNEFPVPETEKELKERKKIEKEKLNKKRSLLARVREEEYKPSVNDLLANGVLTTNPQGNLLLFYKKTGKPVLTHEGKELYFTSLGDVRIFMQTHILPEIVEIKEEPTD